MSPARPDETEAERADRNFGEILQELRVGQTGVQVLFGFLLTMPLQQRFRTFTAFEQTLFALDVVLLAAASVFLIGPVAWHRLLFRRSLKDEIVRAANRMAQVGLGFLGLGITTSVMLVMDIAFERWLAVVLAVAFLVAIACVWVVAPLRRRDAAREHGPTG